MDRQSREIDILKSGRRGAFTNWTRLFETFYAGAQKIISNSSAKC